MELDLEMLMVLAGSQCERLRGGGILENIGGITAIIAMIFLKLKVLLVRFTCHMIRYRSGLGLRTRGSYLA